LNNIAIISARSGSKGLPDKNIKELSGKPLMAYSIEAAIQSECFDDVMVSTDSEKYAEIARIYGAKVPFMRSEATSSDTASSWDVVEEVLQGYEKMGKTFDTICLLQPTSPMRTSEDIKAAYSLYKEKNAIAVLSMTELEHPIEWCGKIDETLSLDRFHNKTEGVRRQDMGKSYRPNGAIYIISVPEFRKDRYLYRGGTYAYIMPQDRSVDIDTEFDFRFAEFLIGR
jgi:CMP-N,N'-diacetyllegionaminic acid synthase